MSDFNSPLVRLVGPQDLPVRIPDWPEEVGIAICRIAGRVGSLQPYHLREAAMPLKRRLIEEVGDAIRGFAIHPPAKGLPTATLTPAEDLQMMSELEQALRSMPRLVEEAADFAINFEFASEEGLSLDSMAEQARQKSGETPGRITDQLLMGYQPFVKPDANCEQISGATLRAAGAAGIDLLLVSEKAIPPRELPTEVQVLVRADSLRVAVPLAGVMIDGKLPKALRLPAGSVVLGETGGKPVPASVLRRGGFLFVAPEYEAVAHPAAAAAAKKSDRNFPWAGVGIGLGGLVVAAMVAIGTWFLLAPGKTVQGPVPPVQDLRDNLFAPRQE